MWPFNRRPDVAMPAPERNRLPCYRSYDVPAGRTWESFRYLIEEREAPWAGEHFIDALVTDLESERDRIVAHLVDDGHEARVTDRRTSEVTYADGSS